MPEEVTDLVRQRLEVPDVDDGYAERDMPHALAAHRLLRHLDTTTVTDNTLVADSLVLAAMAFPVLDRAEDLLAEETILLRLERSVVDRLRLQYFAVTSAPESTPETQD